MDLNQNLRLGCPTLNQLRRQSQPVYSGHAFTVVTLANGPLVTTIKMLVNLPLCGAGLGETVALIIGANVSLGFMVSNFMGTADMGNIGSCVLNGGVNGVTGFTAGGVMGWRLVS